MLKSYDKSRSVQWLRTARYHLTASAICLAEGAAIVVIVYLARGVL